MPSYELSDGSRMDKKKIDRRIAIAKKEYSENFHDGHGYIFCERCKANQHKCPGIARSHIISTDECQKSARTELSWDQRVFEHLGEKCHKDIESWSHEKRELWFWFRQAGFSFDEFVFHYDKEELDMDYSGILFDGNYLMVENYVPNKIK